jgi:hypothetical protein
MCPPWFFYYITFSRQYIGGCHEICSELLLRVSARKAVTFMRLQEAQEKVVLSVYLCVTLNNTGSLCEMMLQENYVCGRFLQKLIEFYSCWSHTVEPRFPLWEDVAGKLCLLCLHCGLGHPAQSARSLSAGYLSHQETVLEVQFDSLLIVWVVTASRPKQPVCTIPTKVVGSFQLGYGRWCVGHTRFIHFLSDYCVCSVLAYLLTGHGSYSVWNWEIFVLYTFIKIYLLIY